MKKIAVTLCLVLILSAARSFAENDSSPGVNARVIIEELENIKVQLADLSNRQQKLLQNLEDLKVIARRH